MADSFKLIWKAEEFTKKLEQRLGKNLDKIGVYLQGQIVRSFGSAPAMPVGWQRPSVIRRKLFKAIRQMKAAEKRQAQRAKAKAKAKRAKAIAKAVVDLRVRKHLQEGAKRHAKWTKG